MIRDGAPPQIVITPVAAPVPLQAIVVPILDGALVVGVRTVVI